MPTVKCTNEECTHHDSEIEVLRDTVLPVLCGGCGKSLACDHEESRSVGGLEGTASRPVLVDRTVCAQCGEQLGERRTELTQDQLDLLPASVLLGSAGAPR